MQFQSQVIRSYFVNVVLSVLPALIFSGIYASYASPTETGSTMLIVMGMIFAVSVALWILAAAINWAYFFFAGRARQAEDLQAALLANGYPTPNESENSAQDYLSRVSHDESLPMAVRFSAHGDRACFDFLRSSAMLQALLQFTFVYEDALRMVRLHRIKAAK